MINHSAISGSTNIISIIFIFIIYKLAKACHFELKLNLKKKKLVFKTFIRKRFDPRGGHHQYRINLKIQKQQKQSANEFN